MTDGNDDRIARMRRALDLARAALEHDASEREAWLAAQCGHNVELCVESIALLRADSAPTHAIERPGNAFAPVDDEPPLPEIGRFRLLERIGSGGMGTVWRAEPVSGIARQNVALKLIKRGMDSDEIVARFVRERGILARLDHPHIARLLDGGIADDGRPWFAMELVDGEPLLAYCDMRQLDIDARLVLFLDVCDAVAYAHRNLVVHRDIKPANVLVAHDGTVKLLDFGIAKLIDPGADEAARTAAPLMTPEYAAPEQYAGEAITTQTDVYQLGGLLRELLSGSRAPAPVRADTREPPRMRDALRELAARDTAASAVLAAARNISSPALQRLLRGDLERIVRRAMQAEPEQRYASVAALADDLRRWRRGAPVSATAGTLGYRARLFLRRHRFGVAAAAAVIVALAIGLGLALREAHQRSVAERASESALTMLEDVFLGADPYAAKGGDTRALDLVDHARTRVLADAARDPAIAARLLFEIGGVYVSLGHREAAESTMRQALEAGDRAGPAASVWTEGARARLAHYALVLDGKPEAAHDLDMAIARLREAGKKGLPELAQALEFKADAAFNSGDYASIPALSSEAVETHRRAGGDDSSDYATALANHASLLRAIGRYGDALEPSEHAYRIVDALGDAAPPSARLYVEQQYAGALGANGRGAQAEPLLKDAFARASTTPSIDRGLVDAIAWELASTQLDIGRFDEAAAGMRALLARIDTKSANLAAIHNALGKAELALGHAGAAFAAFDRASQILCAGDADTLPCLAVGLNRAEALVALGRDADARDAVAALDEKIAADATPVRMRWRVVAAKARLARGDINGAFDVLAPRAASARQAHDSVDIADALVLSDAARIEALRGDSAAALADLREAERRMAALWQGTPPPLVDVRERIAMLDAAARAGKSGAH